MVSKSWLVTVTPLVIAVVTFLKSFVYGTDLTESELELIKLAVGAFVGSGAIGAYLSVRA